MTEGVLHQDWSQVRQGDLLTIEVDEVVGGALGLVVGERTEVVVLSQTCDIVQAGRDHVTVARLDQPPEGSLAFASRGSIPRWALLPGRKSRFVDLHRVVSLHKSSLHVTGHEAGIAPEDWDGERQFAQAIGRNFSRYAFPDNVVPWLDPIRKQIEDKASRPASSIGRVLEDVVEIRLGAEQWHDEPIDLMLYLVVAVGRLGEPDGRPTQELQRWLESPRTLSALADRLRPSAATRPSGADETVLFMAFAEALAALCRKAGESHRSPGVRAAVASIASDVRSEDEFGLNLVRRTERYDVDYLSPPTLTN